MNCNKLHVNLEKSCYMYFNNTRKTENTERSNNFVLNISNTSLPQVENIKFLGVIIDDKLTWQPHLSSLVKKLFFNKTNIFKGAGGSSSKFSRN